MNTAERQHQWKAIMQMTEQLQLLSVDENWHEMNELGTRRHVTLEDFFSTPVSEEEAEAVAQGIRHILESDRQLVETGKRQQLEASAAVKKISTGKQAIKAYTNFREH